MLFAQPKPLGAAYGPLRPPVTVSRIRARTGPAAPLAQRPPVTADSRGVSQAIVNHQDRVRRSLNRNRSTH